FTSTVTPCITSLIVTCPRDGGIGQPRWLSARNARITSTTGSRKSSVLPEIAQPRARVGASRSRAAFQRPFLRKRAHFVPAAQHRRAPHRQARIDVEYPQRSRAHAQPRATPQLNRP